MQFNAKEVKYIDENVIPLLDGVFRCLELENEDEIDLDLAGRLMIKPKEGVRSDAVRDAFIKNYKKKGLYQNMFSGGKKHWIAFYDGLRFLFLRISGQAGTQETKRARNW